MRHLHGRRLAAVLVTGAVTLAGCAGEGADPTTAGASASPAPASRPASPGPKAASASPTATPARSVGTGLNALPSRIVVPDLGIDLPVVSGDLTLPDNPPDYPLCDVAQYLTTYRYPARPGTTTWIYGHAREGMFLPLLEASEQDDGRELIGMTVELYSDAARRYTYRVTEVTRHATDRGIARGVPAEGRRLVLQTSEGPKGTVPKLQIAAEFVDEAPAEPAEAMPSAAPKSCYIP